MFFREEINFGKYSGGTKVFGSCSLKEKQQQEQRVEALECKRTSRATFAHAQIFSLCYRMAEQSTEKNRDKHLHLRHLINHGRLILFAEGVLYI